MGGVRHRGQATWQRKWHHAQHISPGSDTCHTPFRGGEPEIFRPNSPTANSWQHLAPSATTARASQEKRQRQRGQGQGRGEQTGSWKRNGQGGVKPVQSWNWGRKCQIVNVLKEWDAVQKRHSHSRSAHKDGEMWGDIHSYRHISVCVVTSTAHTDLNATCQPLTHAKQIWGTRLWGC